MPCRFWVRETPELAALKRPLACHLLWATPEIRVWSAYLSLAPIIDPGVTPVLSTGEPMDGEPFVYDGKSGRWTFSIELVKADEGFFSAAARIIFLGELRCKLGRKPMAPCHIVKQARRAQGHIEQWGSNTNKSACGADPQSLTAPRWQMYRNRRKSPRDVAWPFHLPT